MAARSRRWLQRHPRLVLAVLLAFGVELAPPPSAVASHRHDGGGVTHTHAGRIAGSPASLAGDPSPRNGIRTASASDLHEHETLPFLGLGAPDAPLSGPVVRVFAAPAAVACGELSVSSRPSQARAPPATVA